MLLVEATGLEVVPVVVVGSQVVAQVSVEDKAFESYFIAVDDLGFERRELFGTVVVVENVLC